MGSGRGVGYPLAVGVRQAVGMGLGRMAGRRGELLLLLLADRMLGRWTV
jgi:hypothetical protein